MPFFTFSKIPLSQAAIIEMLKEKRVKAWTPLTDYKVGTVVEVQLNENLYFYATGVNIENDKHHRLSMHSEQNALVCMLTLLGGDTKFSKLWVMAASSDAVPDPGQKPGKSCGHCRQIMLSLAKPGAKIYAVTLDGRFYEDSFEKQFLPDAFSEKDLHLLSENSVFRGDIIASPKLQAWKIVTESKDLTADEINKYLQVLSPHIISKKFQTSPIIACIVKCNNSRYAVGVLAQDIAFLTTDAVFAVIGNAITQFGGENLWFDEIHLASNTLRSSQLSFAEIEMLSQHYVHSQTKVCFHTSNQHAWYTFEKCMDASYRSVSQFCNCNRSERS